MMTPERFAELTDIYGGQPHRWPSAERDAAIAFTIAHPVEANTILASARQLDDLLDSHAVAVPGANLSRAIFAAAVPKARGARRRVRLWWQGIGFAGLGLAGVLAGALMVAVVLPMHIQPDDDEAAYAATAFGDLSGGDVNQ